MARTINLCIFASDNIQRATLSLLSDLGIEMEVRSEQQIPIPAIVAASLGNTPKAVQDICDKIAESYLAGIISDKTFTGENDAVSFEEACENADKYEQMMVFAVDFKRDEKITRTEMATLTRSLNRASKACPVVLVCRYAEEDGTRFALSLCERTAYKQSGHTGEKAGRVSILRGINPEDPHRGHMDILKGMECSDCATFDSLYEKWQKVFNSELLTKQFYNDLFEWYQWAVSPEAKVTFPGDVDTQDDDREDIDTRIIRLITRLMFVWFIKQKDLIPSSIFNEESLSKILKDFDAQSETEGNYYQAILQNLFFGTLNRPILEDNERREFAKANTADVKNLYRYAELFSISEDEVIKLFSTVPFLNCGLFECQDKTKQMDGVERRFYYDGFSRNARKKNGVFMYRAFVPNVLFFHPTKGIISIFNKYVFTIEENTPQDVQVALDPELLGKVFENLLGYYNPETHDKVVRNESGSFYTPREIVQYMVNESLVAHLKQTVGDELEPQYRQLLDYTTDDIPLTSEQKAQILHSLFTCKILDPACGSGAFPMGMLQQMVHILQQVDPDNTQWRDILLNMAVDESRRAFGIVDEDERKKKLLEIEETFNNGLNSPDYTRKLYIIESCIYGVDIQPIAMLISRLRFFITLICEQTDIQRDKPEQNYGIKTLPNLESKFVAANSLINADIHQYNEDWTNDEVLALLKNELIAIRRRHFYTRKRNEKIRLLKADEAKRKQIHQHINKLVGEPNEAKIKELQQQIADNEKLLEMYQGEDWVEEAVQKDLFSEPQIVRVDRNKRERDRINGVIAACRRDIEREQNKCIPQGFEAAVLQVTDWNPYDQNSVSPFLDIEWMFGVTDGFNIVIGNPPYIRLDINKGRLAKLYEPCNYETFDSKGNIYCLFYERGWSLLCQRGTLTYITLNKWLRADYGINLRRFFTEKTNPTILVDFGGVQVFESANVDTNILLLNKEDYQHRIQVSELKLKDRPNFTSLDKFISCNHVFCNFQGTESWVVMSDYMYKLKKEIEKKGKPLKDWNININYGIKTGFDTAFWVNTQKREEILSWCNTTEEKEKTGKLIRPLLRGKDIKKYGSVWADIWLICTFPSCHYNIEDYPAIKRHLLSFTIERLEQTGRKHSINGEIIKSRKKTSGKWYELQDSISYWKDFDKEKIIYPETTKFIPFVLDKDKYLANKTCFIITGEHTAYLAAFLNSSLFKYCFIDNFPPLGEDRRGLAKIYFERIPVLEVSDSVDAEFRKLILDIQKNYSDEKAKAIDQRIFDLYDLGDKEREVIGYIDFHNNDNETNDDE